jgi:hypothetical protein
MTPREHLARAEKLLSVAEAADDRTAGAWVQVNVQAALCHALIAHAAESGVHHPPEDYPGGG